MLPPEVLQSIFSHVKNDQPTLHASTLVTRTWYQSAISYLYANPIIDGSNFDPFVRAICPSVNAHIRTNGLAELVRRLDMSRLVHNGSKSLTARLLGRVKGSLEEFVAPQASFAYVCLARDLIRDMKPRLLEAPKLGPNVLFSPQDNFHKITVFANPSSINCLAALSKCTNLRLLDLSFVSESLAMSDLLHSIASLPRLEILHLPRSSGHETDRSIALYRWPNKLRELHISGGITDQSVVFIADLPHSVTSLSIGNCPRLSMFTICPLLEASGPRLHYLEIVAPIPYLRVYSGILDDVMNWAPTLRHLKISVDFISEGNFATYDDAGLHHKFLKTLYLHCFDPTECDEDLAAHVLNGVFFGKFTSVRILGIHERLGWRDNEGSKEALMEINTLLRTQVEEEGSEAGIPVDDAGIRFFGTR